jgi:hypothetical protein
LLTFLRLCCCQRLIDLAHRLPHALQIRLPAGAWQRTSAHVNGRLFADLGQRMKTVFRANENRDSPDIRMRNARPALHAPPTVNTRRIPSAACVSVIPYGIVCGSEQICQQLGLFQKFIKEKKSCHKFARPHNSSNAHHRV